MALTLEEANRIAAGALAKAEALGIKINVAVCDGGGLLEQVQQSGSAANAAALLDCVRRGG